MEARPESDLERRRSAQDFVADFLGVVESYRTDPGRIELLRPYLDPLIRSQRASRLIDEPTADEQRAFLELAQDICLDYLTAEDGV